RRVEAQLLPPRHPLLYLLREPRRMRLRLDDALWVRLVDVEAGLAARAWPSHRAVAVALHDAFCPWHPGVGRIDEGRARRAHASPDLKLDASALGSLYLGGASAEELADAGEIEELEPGALDRASLLFRATREPWCPEIF